MVTLMQCIHDNIYTLEHPCYGTLSLSQFLQLKNLKKKNAFVGSTEKKMDFRFGLYSKKYIIKKIPFFYMSLKENITKI